MIDDRLVDGHIGAAGQIGHLPVTASGPLCERGHRGCARSYLSSSAMVTQAAVALQRPDLTYDELISLAEQGDKRRLPGGPRRRLRARHAHRPDHRDHRTQQGDHLR